MSTPIDTSMESGILTIDLGSGIPLHPQGDAGSRLIRNDLDPSSTSKTKMLEPGVIPALHIVVIATDRGSSSAAASFDIESGTR